MSLRLVADCLSLPLPQTQKLILQSLANYIDANNVAFPGRDIIAEESSTTERRLRPHIKALEEAGWIKILSVGNGRGQTSRYLLNVDRIEAESQRVIAERKARRAAQKGDAPAPFSEWEKGDVADTKGDVADTKGDILVKKEDAHVQLTVLPVTNQEPVESRADMEQRVKAEFVGLIPNLESEFLLATKYKTYTFAKASDKEAVLRAFLQRQVRPSKPNNGASYPYQGRGAPQAKPIPPTQHNDEARRLYKERVARERAAQGAVS